ncbi:MAG: porin family protein [Polyangiaceae bacterium]|nr:porin family protein [Polyangiaceae bacterium]
MRISTTLLVYSFSLSIVGAALAQPTPPEPAAPAASADSPASQPAVPAAVPGSTAPQAASSAPLGSPPPAPASSCTLGSHIGVPAPDANTVARMVCAEIAVRQPATTDAYVVSIQPLGQSLVLSAEQRNAARQTVARRSVTLRTIEEVSVAAPRIAESIVKGVPLESTQRVSNILEQEGRTPVRKPGNTYFGIGIMGTAMPGSVSSIAPGIELSLRHETSRLALGGDLRIATNDGESDNEVSFSALSVGGRWFTSDADITPFVGGGLSWSWLEVGDDDFGGEGSGLGFYGEVGVEALRTSKARLVLGLRATLPTYTAKQEVWATPPLSVDGQYTYSEPKQESHYAVPVTLSASVFF